MSHHGTTASDQPAGIPVMIVSSALWIGGAERVAGILAQGLDRQQFQVAACYLKEGGTIADQLRGAGVEVLSLPGSRAGVRDYLTSLKLRRLIRSRGIKIIHTHDLHGLIDGSVCRALVPGLRLVHTFHFGNYPHRYRRYQFIERSTWRMPDALVAVGRNQAELISRCYGIPLNRLHVIWNGVDDPLHGFCAEALQRTTPQKTPVIGSISTLIPQKGLEYLLRAVALMRDRGERFELVVAGGGPLESALRAQVQQLNLGQHVRFLGWVPQASDRVLPQCDIFVQSSLWEAMSIVVLEAMASGKPMVVTQVGDNSRVVLDGETGLLVPPADPTALADGLTKLLHDRDLRQRLGTAARRRYEATFTTQHMIRAYEDLYRELACEGLGNRCPAPRPSSQ